MNMQIKFRWKNNHSLVEIYREDYKQSYEAWLCYYDHCDYWERF